MDVGWLPTAVAVVIFLGAATVYLRGSRDKGTIETLTRSNAALTERVGVLESDQRADRAQIEALTHANRVLTNTVNSADLIVQLKAEVLDALGSHHTAAMTSLTGAMEGLEQLHADLAGLPARFAAVMKDK